MAFTVGELVGYLDVEDKGWNKGLDKAEGRWKGMLKKAGKLAAVGAAAVGAGLAVAGKKALDTGTRLEATGNKAATVFGDQLPLVEKWAGKAAHAMGATRSEATGMASNFADLLIPMGFARDEAAKMATDTVGLAGALAQWSGGTVDAAGASEILSKAMLGEREGLKQLGISITEADVQARLAAKGQEELTGQALEQAKAMATQELILEKSTDAQAAYAEGANKLGLSQAKLGAMLREAWEAVVKVVLPHLTTLATWLADNLPAAIARAQAFIERWGPVVQEVFQQVAAVFIEVRDVVVAVIDRVMSMFKSARGGIDSEGSKIGKILGQLRSTFQSVFDTVRVIVSTVTTVVMELWARFGRHILDFARRTFSRVLDFISGILRAVQGVFDVFAGIFTGDWQRVWGGIRGIVGGVWSAIKAIVGQALDTLKTLLGLAVDRLAWLMREGWDRIKGALADGARGMVEFVAGLPGRILSALGALGSTLYSAGRDLLAGFIRGITSKVKGAVDAVKDAVGSVVGGAKRALGIRSPSAVFADIADQTLEGFIRRTKGRQSDLASVMSSAADRAMAGFNPSLAGLGPSMGGTFPAGAGGATDRSTRLTVNGDLVLGDRREGAVDDLLWKMKTGVR